MTVKLVVLVRKDLDMRAGKIAAQVGHASVLAYKGASVMKRLLWKAASEKLVVLKVANFPELCRIQATAEAHGLRTYPVVDAGRTAVEPWTITCMAIGPDDEAEIDAVMGGLKLL